MNRMLIVGGTGETGSWFARYFKRRGFRVTVWGPSGKREVAEEMGVGYAEDLIREVKESDVVLLSVPIDRTAEVIEELGPNMKTGSLLMDVASLKSEPMRAMLEHAPGDVEVLGTHPMFGPTMKGIGGQTMILVPAKGRCEMWLPIMRTLFQEDGARVEIVGPEEHDQIMAVVQALTHFAYISIGATLKTLDFDVARSRSFMSPVYEIMIDFVGRILAQNPELYANIQENPRARKVRDTYIKECISLAEMTDRGDREGFVKVMKDAAEHFQAREEALVRSDRLIEMKIKDKDEQRPDEHRPDAGGEGPRRLHRRCSPP